MVKEMYSLSLNYFPIFWIKEYALGSDNTSSADSSDSSKYFGLLSTKNPQVFWYFLHDEMLDSHYVYVCGSQNSLSNSYKYSLP